MTFIKVKPHIPYPISLNWHSFPPLPNATTQNISHQNDIIKKGTLSQRGSIFLVLWVQ